MIMSSFDGFKKSSKIQCVCVWGGCTTRQPAKSRQLSMIGWMPSVCYLGQKSSLDS